MVVKCLVLFIGIEKFVAYFLSVKMTNYVCVQCYINLPL